MSKRFISEIIATFSLVFCGTGAMVINDFTGGTVTHVGVAITFGLIVMGMIYAFGDISGAHMNPAVTFGFAYAKKFPWKEVPAYVLAQLIGAFLASGVLLYLFPESQTLGATLPGLPVMKVFVLEIILSFFLMVVIINVSTGSKEEKEFGFGRIKVSCVKLQRNIPTIGEATNPARACISGHSSWCLHSRQTLFAPGRLCTTNWRA